MEGQYPPNAIDLNRTKGGYIGLKCAVASVAVSRSTMMVDSGRRGRSSVAPSPSELQELLNPFGIVLTEQQVILSATTSDIDLAAFRSFMRKQGRSVEEDSLLDIETDLNNASVCSIQDNVLTPNLYGLMVFGRDPQSHPYTTSLFVQFAAYDGTDRAADVLSVGEAGCSCGN